MSACNKKSLVEQVNDFVEIDEKITAKLSADNLHQDLNEFGHIVEMCAEADKLFEDILARLSSEVCLSIHDSAADDFLLAIRRGELPKSIKSFRSILKYIGELPTDVDKYSELAMNELHGEYDYIDYYIRKMLIGPLVLSEEVDKYISSYYREIKELYCLGHDVSCIILCRALIEAVLKDRLDCHRHNLKKTIIKAKDIGCISFGVYESAELIRRVANSVVHLNTNLHSEKQDVEKIIQATLHVVEYVFGRRT